MSKPIVIQDDYKIILRHSLGWKNYKSARLQISVLPDPTFDVRLRSILDWAQENFNDVTLYLHDSIQRYNHLLPGVPPKEAYRRAIEQGDIWLEKNILGSDSFSNVIRWDQLLAHPRYPEAHKKISALYKENEEFAHAVNEDISTFAERCRKRGEIFGEGQRTNSRDFLLEEISGYIPLYQDSSAADIHPGMRMRAMNLLLKGMGKFNLKNNLMITAKTFGRKIQQNKSKIKTPKERENVAA